jgi:holin-like protein
LDFFNGQIRTIVIEIKDKSPFWNDYMVERQSPMAAIHGLAFLLAFQAAGEAMTHALSLPLPGPVVGLVLLLPALRLQWIHDPVALVADFLLAHLSLLFVPVGVGVVTHLDILQRFGWQLALAIAASTWIGMAVSALVLRALLRKDPQAGDGDG